MARTRYTALAAAFALLVLGCQDEPVGALEDGAISLEQGGPYADCTTITTGELYTSTGELIVPGYDEWGYNYQAHLFNGPYCNYHLIYRPGGPLYEWCQENYGNVELVMKWNDAWLSNKDCDDDYLLDRHYGYASYIGSGSWETNNMAGEYEVDGQMCKWTYFVKIIAAPADATLQCAGEPEVCHWYNADGTLIGEEIWGAFAIIESVYNDPCLGETGIEYVSPDHPGFGGW